MTENKIETVPNNVVIPDQEKFNQLIAKFKEQGQDKIHALADFDRTLTSAFVNGQKVPSVISILRDGRFLTSEYVEQAEALFKQYHPFEIDPELDLAEKKNKMNDWWRRHFDLLVKSGLSKKDIAEVVKDPKLQLRPGAVEFFDLLKQHDIPLVIMSSAGLGVESISLILQREKCLSDNIQIISNEFEYDDTGRAIKVKEPVIHMLNKDETVIQNYPAFKEVKDRPNIILLGDNLDDVGMAKGFEYDNIIKIGFLNENPDKNLPHYKKVFDAVILNDGDMGFVNKLMKEIL